MKKEKILLVVCALIFLCGIIGSASALSKTDSQMVEILQDGTVLYRIDLSTRTETETLVIAYHGSTNTVLIENGRICISHADCPDKTCVNMGYLESKSLPIVCLPNHLVIQFADENGGQLDGIVN